MINQLTFVLLFSFLFLVPINVKADSCFTTLFLSDSLFQGISFANGAGGFSFDNFLSKDQNTELLLTAANTVVVAPYYAGFSQQQRLASVVFLGTEAGIVTNYNISFSSNPVLNSVYMSIHLDLNTNNVLIASNFSANTFQTINITLTNGASNVQLTPFAVGNIYIIRSWVNNTNDDRTVKLKVSEISPSGDEVSFRWDVLNDLTSKGTCFILGTQPGQAFDVIENIQNFYLSLNLDVPLWVAACVAVLFVVWGISLILIIVLFIQVKKKTSYNEV